MAYWAGHLYIYIYIYIYIYRSIRFSHCGILGRPLIYIDQSGLAIVAYWAGHLYIYIYIYI